MYMENDNNIKNDFRPVKNANLPIGLIILKNGLFKQPTKNDSEQLKLQKKSDYENLLKQNAAQQAQAKQTPAPAQAQQQQAQQQQAQQQQAQQQQAQQQQAQQQAPAQAKQAPAQVTPTPTPILDIDTAGNTLEEAISVSEQSLTKQKQLEEAERIANEKLERERKENEARLKEAQEKEAQANDMKQNATLEAEKQAAERAAQEAKVAKELAQAKLRQQEAQALKARQEAQVLLAQQEARVKKAQEDASAAIKNATEVARAVEEKAKAGEKKAEEAINKAETKEAKARAVPDKKAAKAEKELAKKQKQEQEKLEEAAKNLEKKAAAAAKEERERFEKNKIIQFKYKGNKNDLKYGIMESEEKKKVVVRIFVDDKEKPDTIKKSWIIDVFKPNQEPKYNVPETPLYYDKYTELTGDFLFYIRGNNDIKYHLKTPNSIDINYTYKITFNNRPPENIRIGNIKYEPNRFNDTDEYKKVMKLINNEDIKEDEVEGIITKIKELINKYKEQNKKQYDNFRKIKGLPPAQGGGKKIKRTRKMKKRKTLKKRYHHKNKQTLKQKHRGNNKRPRYTTKRCRRR